jgi:predicted PurR-regulated permease PerM
VLLVVGAALAVLLLIGGLISWQTAALVKELPDHQDRIHAKLESLRTWFEGQSGGRLSSLLRDVEKAINRKPPSETLAVPVEVVSQAPDWLNRFGGFLGPTIETFVTVLFTIVLAAFLLYNREDMRNRILRLMGARRLTTTTKAIDDAGNRISRYLRVQLMINAVFGVVWALALYLLDVRYPLLWGFVACVMRYVPYIGAWIALLPPMVASLAMSDHWWQPATALAVFATMELITANVVEPRLLGHTLGLSEVAQLVSAAFWAFMWGPIGLVLSGPITACLLVISKNVQRLRPLEVLLGVDEPLAPPMAFFQRLAARDPDEAWRITSEFAAANPDEPIADAVFIPALALAQNATENRELSDDDCRWIETMVREIADDIQTAQPPAEVDEPSAAAERVRILGIAAGAVGDLAALQLLADQLPTSRWEFVFLGESALASDAIAAVRKHKPAVILIVTLASDSLSQTRYICKRLRTVVADAKLVVGRWGNGPIPADLRKDFTGVGADDMTADTDSTKKLLESWWTPLVAAPADDDHASKLEPIGTASAT